MNCKTDNFTTATCSPEKKTIYGNSKYSNDAWHVGDRSFARLLAAVVTTTFIILASI